MHHDRGLTATTHAMIKYLYTDSLETQEIRGPQHLRATIAVTTTTMTTTITTTMVTATTTPMKMTTTTPMKKTTTDMEAMKRSMKVSLGFQLIFCAL